MRQPPEELTLDFEGVPHLFLVAQLPPVAALKLASKLTRILGPAIGDLAGAASGGMTAQVDLGKLGAGLQKVCEELDDSQIDTIVAGLTQAAQVNINGKTSQMTKGLFDNLFTGHLRESFQFLIFVARVNFGEFFQGVAAKGA